MRRTCIYVNYMSSKAGQLFLAFCASGPTQRNVSGEICHAILLQCAKLVARQFPYPVRLRLRLFIIKKNNRTEND